MAGEPTLAGSRSKVLRRHYSRPPVRELIIDLRAHLAPGQVWPVAFGKIAGKLVGRFSMATNLNTPQASGVLLQDDETQRRIQARTDGFTYHSGPGLGTSATTSYGGWESNRDAARAAWLTYRESVAVQTVSRLGVRYVNLIELPVLGDLDDYLLTGIRLGAALSETINALHLQIELNLAEHRSAIVREGLIQIPKPAKAGLILDIDVFETELALLSEDRIWELFEQLHEVENRIFESSITEKTRGLFE
jgi:uncharacterized protein (TIGR04255 family)